MTAQADPLAGYPLRIQLGESALVLRPMADADRAGVIAFAQALPEHDLLFMPRDITDPAQIDAWLADIERGQQITVLALHDDVIVGYATVARRDLHWMRHVTELSVIVAISVRGRGLGRVLTHEAFAIATALGAKKMVAHMTSDQEGAINAFRGLNFETEARLRNEVMDRDGQCHDLVVMSHDVEEFRNKQASNQSLLEEMSRTWYMT